MGLFRNNNILKKNKIAGYILGSAMQIADETIKQIDLSDKKLNIDYNKEITKLLASAYASASQLTYLENHDKISDNDLDNILEAFQQGCFRLINGNESINKYLEYGENASYDLEEILPITKPFYKRMLDSIYDEVIVFDNSKYDTDLEFDKYKEFAEEIHDIIAGMISLGLMVLSQKDIR